MPFSMPKKLKPILSTIESLRNVDWSVPTTENRKSIVNLASSLCSSESSFMTSDEYNRSSMGDVNRALLSSGLFDIITSIFESSKQSLMLSIISDPVADDVRKEAEAMLREITFLICEVLRVSIGKEGRSNSCQASKKTSLLQLIFDQHEAIFLHCVQVLRMHITKDSHGLFSGEQFSLVARQAALILQISALNEKLLITGFLGGKSLQTLIEAGCCSKARPVREIVFSLLKCFDYEVLKANFFVFQNVHEQALLLFEDPDSMQQGAEYLNRVMVTCKALNFRREHTDLLVKNKFLQKQCKRFYGNLEKGRLEAVGLKCVQNVVEVVWDGTNESSFTFEILGRECKDLVDQHFNMLLHFSRRTREEEETSLIRLIRIGLSVIINCHMDFEELTNAAVRESCGITVLNALLGNENLNYEIHAAALDLMIRVSQPFEIAHLKAPAKSIYFLMDHIEKCLNTNSVHECEATTPSGVRLPARNYFKTLNALCSCEQNRGLIFTAGGFSLAQKMLKSPFNYDDVIYPMSLVGEMMDYPDVADKIEVIIQKFTESNFYKLFGKDSDVINQKISQLRRKIEVQKNKNSSAEDSADKHGPLQIMYSACGPLGRTESGIVDFLTQQGYSLTSFEEVRQKTSALTGTRELLSSSYQVLLLFLRSGMEKHPHNCLPNISAAEDVDCFNHVISYFSLTEKKSFVLVATEEDFKMQGWVENFFETTRVLNFLRTDNFNSMLLQELHYIEKFEQNENNVDIFENLFCPWIAEQKNARDREQDAVSNSSEESCEKFRGPVEQWSCKSVGKWLASRGIENYEKLSSLNGKQLSELAALRHNSYELFWNELRNYFQLSMQDCLTLGSILNNSV